MATVTHTMDDGTKLKDITGKVVPINAQTEIAYRTILKVLQRVEREGQNERVRGIIF